MQTLQEQEKIKVLYKLQRALQHVKSLTSLTRRANEVMKMVKKKHNEILSYR